MTSGQRNIIKSNSSFNVLDARGEISKKLDVKKSSEDKKETYCSNVTNKNQPINHSDQASENINQIGKTTEKESSRCIFFDSRMETASNEVPRRNSINTTLNINKNMDFKNNGMKNQKQESEKRNLFEVKKSHGASKDTRKDSVKTWPPSYIDVYGKTVCNRVNTRKRRNTNPTLNLRCDSNTTTKSDFVQSDSFSKVNEQCVYEKTIADARKALEVMDKKYWSNQQNKPRQELHIYLPVV